MSAFQSEWDFLVMNFRHPPKSPAAAAVSSLRLKRTTAPENLMGLQLGPSGRGNGLGGFAGLGFAFNERGVISTRAGSADIDGNLAGLQSLWHFAHQRQAQHAVL